MTLTGSIHPGPPALGRGVIVAPGGVVPEPWVDCARVVVDAATLEAPADAVAALHHHWATRTPVVVELGVDPVDLRQPETSTIPPWSLPATFDFERERLLFLVWSNNYDARTGPPIWWWVRKAERAGAQPGAKADITLPDGRPAWVDGGPRGPVDVNIALVHRESIDIGRLTEAADAASSVALADDQLRAVTHGSGPARVVAPAGSGKTRVLTERLHHLVHARRIEAGLITAVAYNTRAAAELTERLHADVRPEVRTLHSLGFEILRDHARSHGGPAPQLVTERDVRERLSALVPVRPRANTDVLAPYIDGLADIRLGFVDPLRAEAQRDDAPDLARVMQEYRAGLARSGAVDFDELIFGAVELLLREPDARQRARARRRHLLVDEFQDLTPAYLLLVRLIAGPSQQVYGVGDDDQVIYGYAGATPTYLTEFDRWFAGATNYALEVNYRCAPPIVDAAANLLTRNRNRVDKTIRAGRTVDVGAEPALQIERVAAERVAPTVVDQIRRWIDAGRRPGDIAVLSRINAGLLATQVMLAEAGVPCTRTVDPNIVRRTGVRSALAYLRLAASDRWSGNDIAEIANRPSRKIARRLSDPLRRRTWTARALRDRAESLGGRDGERLHGLVDDLEMLTDRAADADTETILRLVRDVVGLGRAIDTLDRSRGGDVASHADDLNALLAVAALHPDPATFADWLVSSLQCESDPDGVHLSSVHRVKGLEWDAVAVVGVDDGLLPHRLADDIEEERRILHVAMTRARDDLLLAVDEASPSPFLAELDEPGEPPEEKPALLPSSARKPSPSGADEPALAADVGTVVALNGGFGGVVSELSADGVVVALNGGGTTRLRFGDQVSIDGRLGALGAPEPDESVREALRHWRSERAKADGVPAYVVFSNEHIDDIARRRPTSLDELSDCKGVGPARLERYGDDVLDVLDGVS